MVFSSMLLILFYRFRRINPSKNIESKINKKLFYALREYRNLFFVIMGILFFTSIIKGTITTFLTVYLTNDGETLWYAGAALSIFQFAGAGGTFFSGTMSDKIGRRNVLIFASVINPILLLLFVYTTGIPAFIVLLLLGFFLFSFTPVLLAIVNESKTEFPTFLNGIFMTINFLTSAVTISIIGFAADYFSLEATYIASAIVGFLTIPFAYKLHS